MESGGNVGLYFPSTDVHFLSVPAPRPGSLSTFKSHNYSLRFFMARDAGAIYCERYLGPRNVRIFRGISRVPRAILMFDMMEDKYIYYTTLLVFLMLLHPNPPAFRHFLWLAVLCAKHDLTRADRYPPDL